MTLRYSQFHCIAQIDHVKIETKYQTTSQTRFHGTLIRAIFIHASLKCA